MNLSSFTNRFQLSKTLRFELIPQGKTLEHIHHKGLLDKDENLASSYKKMKTTIDLFHKDFIDKAMQNVHLSSLHDFYELYTALPEKKKEDSFKKNLEKVQSELRKEIALGFRTGEVKQVFDKLDKKELITDLLEEWVEKQNRLGKEIYFGSEFKSFTTYFSGFNENRKNMYSDKAQSTAISYRLIHENLSKFIDNIHVFDKILSHSELIDKIRLIHANLNEHQPIASLEEIFSLDYFNQVLSQKQIDTYNYIIGGFVPQDGSIKIKGLNEEINRYNQGVKDKKDRISKFKVLYKQILSDRESVSFIPDEFISGEEVAKAIYSYYHYELIEFKPKDLNDTINVLVELKVLLSDLSFFDLQKVYIKNDSQLTTISQRLFGSFSVLGDAVSYFYDKVVYPNYQDVYSAAKETKQKKLEKEKLAYIKAPFLSLAVIQQALDVYVPNLDLDHPIREAYSSTIFTNYFRAHFKAQKKTEEDKDFDLIAAVLAKYSCIKGLIENYPTGKEFHQITGFIDNIKLFLDSLMEVLHFVKPLILPPDETLEKDNVFYSQLDPLYRQLEFLVPLYNKVRNYATRKPYSTGKFKLNFECSELMNGWDANKESAYLSVLLRRNDNYFLAIMDKKNNKVLKNIPKSHSGTGYEKMIYKLLPGPNKMLPKVFFAKKNIEYFNPSVELLEKYKRETHKKGEHFSLEDCHALIDFFKQSIKNHEDWNCFNFQFSDTAAYKDLSGFYKEVSQQGYKLSFEEIDVETVDRLVEDGKLFLFKIYNKDFSPYSKGLPNIHTLYWKAIFDSNNLENTIYKLNGQAELFYRKSSIEKENTVVHAAYEPIANKNPLNPKKESTFTYPLIKDKRYTTDRFLFHVPISMNFKAEGSENINREVLSFLKNNPDVNIIGIDRGERHLIYLTLIDQQGNILQQESLNSIINDDISISTPYHTLLTIRENSREEARKNWGAIESIKELKEGYLSQVVHKIAKMMVQYNAIVVMEDLNFGFKRGRFKVEKQVYQKLEKQLIEKLNYLVFKKVDADLPGGLLNALQLTSKFSSFKDLGKQSGFLFYVPAWNTSKIDPTTGFVNLFDTKYESVAKAQHFFNEFAAIRFNAEANYFEFKFDYRNFTTKADGTRTDWTLCTYGKRIHSFRNEGKLNQWDNEEVDLTMKLEDLFGREGIVYGDGLDLKKQIVLQENSTFFKELLHYFKLTLQMRNSISSTAVDYLISPVMNAHGFFYDSRNCDGSLPKDADANGAYHIAKKGLWVLNQINNANDFNNLNLAVSNKDWLNFVQNK